MKIKVKECKYCDGTIARHLYGKDEPLCCATCGAEWEPIECEYDMEETRDGEQV